MDKSEDAPQSSIFPKLAVLAVLVGIAFSIAFSNRAIAASLWGVILVVGAVFIGGIAVAWADKPMNAFGGLAVAGLMLISSGFVSGHGESAPTGPDRATYVPSPPADVEPAQDDVEPAQDVEPAHGEYDPSKDSEICVALKLELRAMPDVTTEDKEAFLLATAQVLAMCNPEFYAN